MACPIQSLLARLGSRGYQDEWSKYLPERLQILHNARQAPGCIPDLEEQELRDSENTSAASVGSNARVSDSIPVRGRVWTLAQEAHGCRWVQEAIQRASREERVALASELHGHVLAAARSPHANHVLQRCILTMAPEDVQFIIDELVEAGVTDVARNKYGCRIVQRLIEQCPRHQTRGLLEAILAEVPMLSRHPYSNYVLENVLLHGSCEDRQRIVSVAVDCAAELCQEPHGCVVVLAAFEVVAPERQCDMAERLAREDGLLVSMACSKQGAALLSRVLAALREQERVRAAAAIVAAVRMAGVSEYGMVVLARLGIPVAGSATA